MSKWQKRPATIEACQFHPDTPHIHGEGKCPLSFVSWEYHPGMGHTGECPTETCKKYPRVPVVFTTQGAVQLKNGDWVALQVVNGQNDVWPIAEATFAANYEAVLS